MTTPQQSRADLAVVTGYAADDVVSLFDSVHGSPETRRAALLEGVPGVVDYYATGSSVLAADFYDERRELAGAKKTYSTELVINDRTVKIRRAVAWSTEPMFGSTGISDADMAEVVRKRLVGIAQSEVARPYRDTIIRNRQKDSESVGWRRVQGDSCPFCRLLADRGAVYREATARFASHPHCDCGAEPVFQGQTVGPEASTMQYMASKRSKTPKQKAELKAYLDTFYS